MAITKRRSEAIWIESKGYWQVKVQRDGTRKGFTSSTPGRRGKHEAEAKADEWLESGTEDMRFDLAWTEYLKYVETNTGKSNYIKIEVIGRLHISPSIGTKRLSRIVPIDWQKCVDATKAKGLSKRSCTNVLRTISSFINFARRSGWTITRPEPRAVRVMPGAPVGKRTVLQPADIRVLFSKDTIEYRGETIKARDIHAWRLYVLTGLRRGELCGLKDREDVDENTIHVQRSVNFLNEETAGKNENARRDIRMSARAKAEVSAQRAMLKSEGIISPWLFPDENGDRMSPDAMYRHWRMYREQHGIKSSIHELRHTFVSAVKSDMPEPLLKMMVGHSVDMDTFGVYGQEMDSDCVQYAEIVDNVFGRLLSDPER